MSTTQKKTDLRLEIHQRIALYLTDHPDAACATAMDAIRQLSGRMTLSELREWRDTLEKQKPQP